MTIPFYTKNIHEPLQQMLYDADNNGNFQPVIDYCEPLIETTEEDGVLLCYTFALMENALAIHVDDVEETGKKCLEILKRLKHTYGGTDAWKRTIKQSIKYAKDRKNTEKEILSKPIKNLTSREKANLAYQLADKGGIGNYSKAALLHLDLMRKNENELEEPYHYGSYIICLYRSNQIELADKTFDEFLIWHSQQINQSYSFFVHSCYEAKLMNYLSDKTMIEKIWNEAKQNEIVTKYDFPIAETNQDELLVTADTFGLNEIKKELISIIVRDRKPRMIPEAIKRIIEK